MNTALSFSRVLPTGTSPAFPGHKDLGINLSSLANPGYSVFSMSISDYFGISWYALSRIPRTQYNLQHGWTLVKGRHDFAFGLDATTVGRRRAVPRVDRLKRWFERGARARLGPRGRPAAGHAAIDVLTRPVTAGLSQTIQRVLLGRPMLRLP